MLTVAGGSGWKWNVCGITAMSLGGGESGSWKWRLPLAALAGGREGGAAFAESEGRFVMVRSAVDALALFPLLLGKTVAPSPGPAEVGGGGGMSAWYGAARGQSSEPAGCWGASYMPFCQVRMRCMGSVWASCLLPP